MLSSHPRPNRARARQTVALLVVTCISLLAIGAGATARTAIPSATISTAFRHAVALRDVDRRILARNHATLSVCLRAHAGGCTSKRHAVSHAHVRLAAAERRLRGVSADTSHRHSVHHTPTLTPAPTPTPLPTPVDTGEGSTGTASGNFGQPFVKGVNTNLQGWGPTAEPQVAREITTVGAQWAREDLNWSKVEPQRGVFDWSSFDRMVSVAKANGITILPVAGYAPSWTTPDNSDDYAAFIAAAVARYGPGTPANLETWELWNEPYYAYAWSGKPGDPGAYARDVLAASQAAKELAPTVKVLIAAEDGDAATAGGGWWTTSVDAYFAAVPDLGEWIDGVAVHPYGQDPSLPVKEADGFRASSGGWSFQRIDSVRSDFAAHGVNVPFWITEIGWTTSEVSEAAQAHDYEDLTTQVAARPWIRAMFSYCLREFNNNPSDSEAQFGLEKYGTWQPKPAFYALQKGFATLS